MNAMLRSCIASLASVVTVALNGAHAELLVFDQPVSPAYYSHPVLHSLSFVSPETRAQAILPPAPVFVAPAPLIWRAPSALTAYPPTMPTGFNYSGTPSNRDLAAYNLARAHAFSQNLYRRDGNANVWYGSPQANTWYWLGVPLLYPPLAPGLSHPSNRDNASHLLERAHRFSQDGYRKP